MGIAAKLEISGTAIIAALMSSFVAAAFFAAAEVVVAGEMVPVPVSPSFVAVQTLLRSFMRQ
jgi:hypothetical protein